MSRSNSTAHVALPEGAKPPICLVRLPVDKPQPAVAFLHARSEGVMDLIAHFWERLAQTPPLQRGDLHLVVAVKADVVSTSADINIQTLDPDNLSGAMLYVPKAHRADVLAMDAGAAQAFAGYIVQKGGGGSAAAGSAATGAFGGAGGGGMAGGTGLASTGNGAMQGGGSGLAAIASNIEQRTMAIKDMTGARVSDSATDSSSTGGTTGNGGNGNGGAAGNGGAVGRVAIDFLTGGAEGLQWMVPLLLPHVGRKSPERELVNVVMQLPPTVKAEIDAAVRMARDPDQPLLNRWRRQYKEERGLAFDADIDAMVDAERVFVYEYQGQVVAVAKFDLELAQIVEIGGVYTFPEFRKMGFGAKIVADLAARIRSKGKTPVLQVDHVNDPALRLYTAAGWKSMGRLGRVWLTG